MRLHDYAASGNCYKARLLLALLGREYERVPVDIFAGDTLTSEFGALNPVRETPVLELDSGGVIAQSSAILWYLAEATPFLPTAQLEREAGLDPGPHMRAWFQRVRSLPGVVADLEPYGDNARLGAGRSIHG
jgi:glutathione S-transferase